MMDQNRCLLDVIDNPQLLQSFLQSESSTDTATHSNQNVTAETNVATNHTSNTADAIPDSNNVVDPYTSYSQHGSTTTLSHSSQSSGMISAPQPPTEFTPQTYVTDSQLIDNDAFLKNPHSPISDPVVSVLDSIIKETVAEVSPTPANDSDYNNSLYTSAEPTNRSPTDGSQAITYSTDGGANSLDPSATDETIDVNLSSPALDSTPAYHQVETSNIIGTNDPNNNSTSENSDNGSNGLLVDEYYSHHLQTNQDPSEASHQDTVQNQGSQLQPNHEEPKSRPSPPDDTSTTATGEESLTKDSSIEQPQKLETSQNQYVEQTQPPWLQPQQPQQPQLQQQHKDDQAQPQPMQEHPPTEEAFPGPDLIQTQSAPEETPTKTIQQQSTTTTTGPTATIAQQSPSQEPPSIPVPTSQTKPAAKNAKSTNKTEPKTKPKPRPKKAKVSNAPAAPTQSQATITNQAKPMQTQFISANPGQQQVIFQTNNGIRQPVMMAQPSMGQPINVGMPQPQRVIQIQTANGPMYFAIAPGPATSTGSNSGMMNQQPGLQAGQFAQPQQQICFQSNPNVMMTRPQIVQQQQMGSPRQPSPMQQQSNQQFQQVSQTQQQQQLSNQQASGNMMVSGPQMVQSPQQTRMGSPVVGQTMTMSNQLNNAQQQQQMMLPSSQPMMMPRMQNQIMINRPIGSTGQLLPGQQQFIQILTPNGPMLLALPTQPSQTQQVNNTMIDFNGQIRLGQPLQHNPTLQMKQNDTPDSGTSQKQSGTNSGKNNSNSKSGLDLGDLLLDCGILPDDRAASQSSSSVKSSHSPSLSQMSSPMPSMPQNNSPLPPTATSPYPTSHPTQPQPMTNYGQYQGQPIRISMGPDGQMIMQPAVYSAIRPVMSGPMGQQQQMNTMGQNNMMQSGSPMMAISSPSPSFPRPMNDQSTPPTDNSKKPAAKGKGTAVKRNRSKKSDVEKFPQLKTPKIAQQQQQQQKQTVVVPMSYLVGDQGKPLSACSDVKPNVAQLASGQQVSVAKFVTPVMQPVQTHLGGAMIQSSIAAQANMMSTPNSFDQSQTQMMNTGQYSTQIIQNHSINVSSMQQSSITTSSTSSTTSNMSSSGNVSKNLSKTDTISGTVESNSHISSSLMPSISLSVDTLKIEQNGLKTIKPGPGQTLNIKSLSHNVGGLTTTLVLRPAQVQLQHSSQTQAQILQMQMQQQLVRQKELRVQGILNQLGADQNAALHPQTKQSFKSLEDACKRLLRYHVFDTETVSEDKINKVDEIFEAAAESLLTRKQAIYDKFRYLILKQSMKTVPSSEEVMLDQMFVNDELSILKKDKELFKEYEAHLESIAIDQARESSKAELEKEDSGPDYFAFGSSSPKTKIQDDQDNASHSRDVDDWLMPDKWGDSRYSSVPDSEAATAIESILNEELS